MRVPASQIQRTRSVARGTLKLYPWQGKECDVLNLNNIKTGTRLALCVGTLTALLLLLAGSAWWEMAAINRNMAIAIDEAAKASATKEVVKVLDDLYMQMWGLVAAKDAASKQAYKAAVARYREAYLEKLASLKAAANTTEGLELCVKLETTVAGAREANLRVSEMAFKAEGQSAEAMQLYAAENMKYKTDKIESVAQEIVSWRGKRAQDTNAAAEAAYRQACWILAVGACIAVGLGIALGWVVTRSIVVPIRDCVAFTGLLAQGDFSRDVPDSFRGRGDEMGELARAYHTMVNNTRALLKNLSGGVETVASSATALSATATQLSSGAEETTHQSAQVAAAAEEMSSNMNAMAASSEQMSANVSTVSAAVEELTTSVGEMAKSAERAASTAANAAQLVDASNSQIGDLGNAADQIGKVIEVIQDIAEQTNLLALNATIEAARAGEAGKGFAVVATEVKELAKQTASATEDIRHRIEGIQNSTGQAVKSMAGIGDVVRQVNELSRTIASAVEEQSITTQEIAKSIAQASNAAQTVAKGVTESATASQEIARIIVGVDEAAKQAAVGAAQTQSSGHGLSQVADQIRSVLGTFKA